MCLGHSQVALGPPGLHAMPPRSAWTCFGVQGLRTPKEAFPVRAHPEFQCGRSHCLMWQGNAYALLHHSPGLWLVMHF